MPRTRERRARGFAVSVEAVAVADLLLEGAGMRHKERISRTCGWVIFAVAVAEAEVMSSTSSGQ